MKPQILCSATILACMLLVFSAYSQTGIGTTTPHASAALDITSTTRGLLPPRMTASQRVAIASPAAGLMVYDVDSAGCMLFNGVGWQRLGSGGGGQFWAASSGNGGSGIYSTNAGNVGIGVTNPQFGKLHVETTTPNLPSIYVHNNTATGTNYSISAEVSSATGAAVMGSSFTSGGTSTTESSKYGVVGTAGSGGVGVGAYVNSGVAFRAKLMSGSGYAISSDGPIQLTGISEGAGKVLTSDASGNASWQTPSGGGGGSSLWTAAGNDIYHNNTGKVLVGGLTAADPFAKGKLWVNETSSFGMGIRSWTSAAYGTAIYAADSGLSGGPAGCTGCSGSAALKGYSKYGDALFAHSSNGRGIYLMGGSSFWPAMVIDINAGATNALELNGKIKIADGSQVANAVLTCDANGLATWMPPSGGGGGTTYTAGSGISIAGSVISAVDNSAANELQTISLTGGTTLTLSNGGGSVTLPSATPSGWNVSGNDIVNTGFSSGGKVMIGTNNPFPNTRMSVVGGTSGATAATFSAGTGGYALLTNTGNVGIGSLAPSEKLEVCGNTKVNGNIDASGNINANQSITCSSDIRYKKDIATLSGALGKLLQLRGVTYNWKREEFPAKQFNDRLQIGFIAQEIEKVYPELVYTDKDGYKAVDYAKLTPVLLEALKELKAQNDALAQSNQDLRANSASIELRLSKIEQLLIAMPTEEVTSITASKN